MNLAGTYGRLLWTWSANAIANIAHRRHALACGQSESGRDKSTRAGGTPIVNRLARLAGQSGARRPDAARRHNRHIASMEVRPKGQRNASAGGGCAACYWGGRVRCAIRIDVESAIFLNNPPIVGYNGRLIFAVQNLHYKIAGRQELQRNGRWSADRPLRVLCVVSKTVGATRG